MKKTITLLLMMVLFCRVVGQPDLKATQSCDSMQTTFAGGNYLRGNMFDIVALHTVTIKTFEIHLADTANIKVYFHLGTYLGTENIDTAWTLAATFLHIYPSAFGQPTKLPYNFNKIIPAGQTGAFYVTTTSTSANLYYSNGTSQGAVYAQNSDVLLLEGCGIDYPFLGTPHTPRIWNGKVKYCYTPVGIDEMSLETLESAIYPNPFSDFTTLKINSSAPSIYSLKIFDVVGTLVNEINNITTDELKIEKGKLTSGIYIYRLISKDGFFGNGKFIVD